MLSDSVLIFSEDHGVQFTSRYSLRKTIYKYKKKSGGLDKNDTYTQFAYACKTFEVDIKTTSVNRHIVRN